METEPAECRGRKSRMQAQISYCAAGSEEPAAGKPINRLSPDKERTGGVTLDPLPFLARTRPKGSNIAFRTMPDGMDETGREICN